MDERIGLTSREYKALRMVFGIVNGFEICAPEIEKRAAMTEHGTELIARIRQDGETLMNELLRTVPAQKLKSIQRDLQNTFCEVNVKYPVAPDRKDDYIYVSSAAVDGILQKVTQWECLVCEKTAREGKKCDVFKAIDALLPWELEKKGERCPLCGDVMR